ncbi:MAG: hypothetical protein QM220_03705 [Atribacterota bacterium]|jgi:hypothetical protein|nr:hypothetical protein [Atribacterota bacterium]
MKISQRKFEEYYRVQKSGKTNMFDIRMVMVLSGLTKEECLNIMENYAEYYKKFKGGK